MNFFLLAHIPDFTAEVGAASPEASPVRRDSLCAMPRRASLTLPQPRSPTSPSQPRSPTSPHERSAPPSLRDIQSFSSLIPPESLRPRRKSTSPIFRQQHQQRWSTAPSFPSQTLQALHSPYGPPLKPCAPPLAVSEVMGKVKRADEEGDWLEVLKWQGRMEELMEGQTDATCKAIHRCFQTARRGIWSAVPRDVPSFSA